MLDTIFLADSDRVLALVKSSRANIVDASAVSVAISRARKLATLYTDSRADLTEVLGIRDRALVGALDEAVKMPTLMTATPAPAKAVSMTVGR